MNKVHLVEIGFQIMNWKQFQCYFKLSLNSDKGSNVYLLAKIFTVIWIVNCKSQHDNENIELDIQTNLDIVL